MGGKRTGILAFFHFLVKCLVYVVIGTACWLLTAELGAVNSGAAASTLWAGMC
jgi:hypothetical protein